MSEVRGIEIHNGYVNLPSLRMDGEILLGTEASPIIMTALDQRLITAIMSATTLELAGTIQPFLARAMASRTITGNLRTARIDAFALAGAVISGDLRAAYIRAVARGDGEVTGEFTALYIEMNIDATAVLSGDAAAIHIGNMMGVAPAQEYSIIRLDENGGATIDNFIFAHVGGGSDINYFLYASAATSAWDRVDDKTSGVTPAGWIRVIIAGQVSYIALYPA